MSSDPVSLNQGMRRANTGAYDTVFGKTYLICIIAQVLKFALATGSCVRGELLIAIENVDLWSGEPHTTHYYYTYHICAFTDTQQKWALKT